MSYDSLFLCIGNCHRFPDEADSWKMGLEKKWEYDDISILCCIVNII